MTKSHTIKTDNGTLGESFKTVGGEHGWEGQDIEVHSDPLIETGARGQTLVFRSFYFKANPQVMKSQKPTKQQIFDSHAKQIQLMLYSDGLIPFKGVEPKLIVSKKRDEYKIFVACEARAGVSFAETPRTLQELTKPNAA